MCVCVCVWQQVLSRVSRIVFLGGGGYRPPVWLMVRLWVLAMFPVVACCGLHELVTHVHRVCPVGWPSWVNDSRRTVVRAVVGSGTGKAAALKHGVSRTTFNSCAHWCLALVRGRSCLCGEVVWQDVSCVSNA